MIGVGLAREVKYKQSLEESVGLSRQISKAKSLHTGVN